MHSTTTTLAGLTTFPAPGPFRAPGEPIPARVTGAPLVTLVDIDGFAVPVGEKDIPETFPPDPTDPNDWPAWTDNWLWETTEPVDRADAALAAASLEDLPFVPSAEDLADYAEWSAGLESRREQLDFYARHPLSEFNAIRCD